MKLLVALILSAFVLQTLGLPAFEDAKVEDVPKTASEIVDAFRVAILFENTRFQAIYDRTSAEMRNYRMSHVALIHEIYEDMMRVKGGDIDIMRSSGEEVRRVIAGRQEVLGQNNACLNSVSEDFERNSAQTGGILNSCSVYANRTMENMLTNVFYPDFSEIQQAMSTVNVAVIDAMSRGNILNDEQDILEHCRALYLIKTQQWTTAVSQRLRWATNRFRIDGLFMVDEMSVCYSGAVLSYINTNSQLEVRAAACT